jgi:hypothetical protein
MTPGEEKTKRWPVSVRYLFGTMTLVAASLALIQYAVDKRQWVLANVCLFSLGGSIGALIGRYVSKTFFGVFIGFLLGGIALDCILFVVLLRTYR